MTISKVAHDAAVRFVEGVIRMRGGPAGALSSARRMSHERSYRRRPQWLQQSLELLDALVREEELKGQPLTEVERLDIFKRRAP